MSGKIPNWYRQAIFSDISQTVELLESELQQTLGVLERRACNPDVRMQMSEDILSAMKGWFGKDAFLVNNFEQELIGSSATGLGPNTAHIDMYLYNTRCNYTKQECINTLKRFHSRCPTYLSPRIVTHTLIPYLEFQCPYHILMKYASSTTQRPNKAATPSSPTPNTSLQRLIVNVSIQNHIGAATTTLFKLYNKISPFLRQLCLLTRYWASQKNLISYSEIVPIKHRDFETRVLSPPSGPSSFIIDEDAPFHADYTISPANQQLLSPFALTLLVLFSLQCQHILPAAQCRTSVAAAGCDLTVCMKDGLDLSIWDAEDVKEKWEKYLQHQRQLSAAATAIAYEQLEKKVPFNGDTGMSPQIQHATQHVEPQPQQLQQPSLKSVNNGDKSNSAKSGRAKWSEVASGTINAKDAAVASVEASVGAPASAGVEASGGVWKSKRAAAAMSSAAMSAPVIGTDVSAAATAGGSIDVDVDVDGCEEDEDGEHVVIDEYKEIKLVTALYRFFKMYLQLRTDRLIPSPRRGAFLSAYSKRTKWAPAINFYNATQVTTPAQPPKSPVSPAPPGKKQPGKKNNKSFPPRYFPVEDPFFPTHDICENMSVTTRDRLWMALSHAVEMMDDGELPFDVLIGGNIHKILHKLKHK